MILTIAIILGLALGGTLGFAQGVRYCTKKLLPRILATMDPRELASVAEKASKLREVNSL